MGKKIFRLVLILVVAGAAFFLLIQLIPYGKNHLNPPVVSEPKWDSSQTRELAKRACFDCHSNETVWPWYSNIAPVSWLVYRDAVEARQVFNFSDWNNFPKESSSEVSEVIIGGEMPPPQYLLMHPPARLSQAEKQQLINGLIRTIGQ